jgi:Tubulin like
MAMNLFQPVLFVGLGGTGCDIGAEFERRVREEICGPDGNLFRHNKRVGAGMLQYQLPSCLQFVYADMSQAELAQLPGRVVPDSQHIAAVRQTAQYVTNLVPRVDSYPELARNLRLEASKVVSSWLPPENGEPKVNPLYRGTGQFPTIGRAALFGTFMKDTEPATENLREAIGRLANSGSDLYALGGHQQVRAVDVFVAFSVAGGTGGGIFYDYLHLAGNLFRQSDSLRVRIYPLVLMPSAFDSGLGGGRAAQLNAGRALLDLFRLVDQQNGADAERELYTAHEDREIDPEEQAVYYPRSPRIRLRPGIVQTGFLFCRPSGATRIDMHRSVVSLVMSLIGTGMEQRDNRTGEAYQSFADSFVNSLADNGIGSRGVSTALVASLTVPVDDLAGILSARLLATAIGQMAAPNPQIESNGPSIKEFLTKAHVYPVVLQQGSEFHEPEPVNGARAVALALNDRRENMKAGIADLKGHLAQEVPTLAGRFAPLDAMRELLGQLDAFRVQRIVFGHTSFADDVQRHGAEGTLHRRQAPPATPNGFGVAPPPVPEMHDRLLGQSKVKWTDGVPVAAREEQDDWYAYSTEVAWATLWAAHAPQWERALREARDDLNALTKALEKFASQDKEDFQRRSDTLYAKRVGVSYLLPTGAGRMEQFYSRMIRRLREQASQRDPQLASAQEAQLVATLLPAGAWRDAFQLSIEHGPDRAVTSLKEQLKTAVKTFLREAPPGSQPMLPRLNDLLAAAAGHGTGGHGGLSEADQEYLEEFSGKLAGLVPANFTPQGSGPLKVLISYPADAPSEVIEQHLGSSVNVPSGPEIDYEYRPTSTESIAVVLFRTSMGLTEVAEVRDVLRLWAGALSRPEPADMPRWRQRTGYDFGYLATRETHRVAILHRLLCALWNGRGTATGPDASPERLRIQLDGDVAMSLPLTPVGDASSWGSLLRWYELWALDDDDIHSRFSRQLLKELPGGLDSRPVPPNALYMTVRDLAEGQIDELTLMMAQQGPAQRSRTAQMLAFWKKTLPAALDREFEGLESPVARNLRELEAVAWSGR